MHRFCPRQSTRRRSWILSIVVLAALLGVALSPRAGHAAASISVGPDNDGSDPRRPPQTAIFVAGSGSTVTLADINTVPAVGSLLEDQGNGVWYLRANLVIEHGVTLQLTRLAGVRELRLRSEASAGGAPAEECGNAPRPACDYGSFVYLRTNDGTINITGNSASQRVKIVSWSGAGVDTEYANGRSYVLAKYDAALNIRFAELAYLGSADGESYGVAWRDINASNSPNTLRTRVTGQVQDSLFHHNYYGVYTYQAANMSFRRNQFYDNVKYGFDPHDYTHHVVVEDNQAYRNGDHGFIISRGCNNFTFRRNVSYNNLAADPGKLAHGFMLDSGSPNSAEPQAASYDNLLENNEAYGNEGYGLRILGSTDNVVRNNNFHDNREGITVEQGSTGNVIVGNTIADNANHGIFVRGSADRTTVTGNTLTGNTATGIYIKSNNNTIANNTVTGTTAGDGITAMPESTAAAAQADLTAPNEMRSAAASDPELVGTVAAAAELTGNTFTGNAVSGNAVHGFELRSVVGAELENNTVFNNSQHGFYLTDGSTDNRLVRNTIRANGGQGVRINGTAALRNTVSENVIFGNSGGGIALTSGANGGIVPPVLDSVAGTTVSGRAPAGTIVEIFTNAGGDQGQFFEGRTTALPNGTFVFTKAGSFSGNNINLTGTDTDGNTSAFGIGSFIDTTLRQYLPIIVR